VGKDAEAVTHLRQAIAAYDRMPESTASLNNSSNACHSLFLLTGARRDFDQRVARLEKALALDPRHALVLGNTADALLESGIWDIVGARLDLGALRLPGHIGVLAYLTQDEAERKQYAQRLVANPKVARARAHFERLLVLAPKSTAAYSSLTSILTATDNRDGLKALLHSLEGVELDLADEARQSREYYAGTKDAQHREETASMTRRYEAIVDQTRTKGGPTFAVAAATLMTARIHGDELGLAADADAVVRLAEEAHAAAPSQGTSAALAEALAFRAVRSLASHDPAFARVVKRCQRSCHSQDLLAAILSANPAWAEAARADADFQRLVQLVLEYDRRFPSQPSPMDWALLRAARRDEAADLGRRVLADETSALSRAINLRVAPLNAANVLRISWQRQLAGKDAEGRAILKHLSEQGVPLPMEVK
jgi:hypothetical protein